MLHPNEMVEVKTPSGNSSRCSVFHVLCQKHPDPTIPSKSALLTCRELPKFEDIEVTGNHVLHVAHMIQGGGGPGGCDANHWQDSLMCYGAHNECLCESVAAVAHQLANSIVPWSDIRALMASRLIALDKCTGV